MPSKRIIVGEAILYGAGQTILFYVLALLYYVGAVFIKNGDLTYGNFQKALMTLLFAGMGRGKASQYAGDAGVSAASAVKIYSF